MIVHCEEAFDSAFVKDAYFMIIEISYIPNSEEEY